jgi:hypothetical protein
MIKRTCPRSTTRKSYVTAALCAVVAAVALTACTAANGTAANGTTDREAASNESASAAPATSAPANTPAPTPSPAGKYVGSCNYTLNDNFNSNIAADATGDIQVTNTGNIGIIVTLKMTWPQEGYNPLVMRKHGVHIADGASRDIEFHMPLSQDQISNLQNWQLGHNDASGCTYKVRIDSTFGSAG